jgi:hypothetical protein
MMIAIGELFDRLVGARYRVAATTSVPGGLTEILTHDQERVLDELLKIAGSAGAFQMACCGLATRRSARQPSTMSCATCRT